MSIPMFGVPIRSHRQASLWYATAVLVGLLLGSTLALWPRVARAAAAHAPASVDRLSRSREVSARSRPTMESDISGTVTDSASGQPLPAVDLEVMQGSQTVVKVSSDAFGHYIVQNLPVGTYDVVARLVGFQAIHKQVTLTPDSGTVHLDFRLVAVSVSLQAVNVTASTPIAVDTRTGDQTFKQDQYHGAPTTTTSQILQQSMASAARAPTGEVHIKGQHAEYQYYVDGVPVPSGVSGSLNELFDPQVVNKIDFQTGGWDAEYGEKNIAVVNIQTQIPSGGLHGSVSGYGGSFNTNGQSASLSDNIGKLGMYFSGTRQETGMRREPVVFDTVDNTYRNYHNSGQDQFGFGKLQYTASDHDFMTLEANGSRTHFLVPFDSSQGITDDRQTDFNSFINFGYHHRFGTGEISDQKMPSEFFLGAFVRHGSLNYVPGSIDQPSLTYGTDTTTKYNVSENRSFDTYGVKADYSTRILPSMQLKFGTLVSQTSGNENFQLTDPTGSHSPIQSISGLNGHDFAAYVQSVISLGDRIEIRPGVRYNTHVAPFAGNQTQWSPRLRLNFYLDPSNTLYAYYGKLFIPTNIEDLRSITFAAQQNTATPTPTLPERDDYYEAGVIHRFPGVVAKLDGYYKRSKPGIDDNTVPGSSITTSVNLHDVYVEGIETVLEIRPKGPLSGYLNASIIHAYGDPPVYGGFFFLDQPNARYFDLDHDQRLSMVAGLTYSVGRFYMSTTGTYGSGLTNGITPDSSVHTDQPGQPSISHYCTGLFCLNAPFKVSPSYIESFSAGYSLVVGQTVVRPEFFIDNAFNRSYLLKGAFFSGASVGRPRSIQFRMNIGV